MKVLLLVISNLLFIVAITAQTSSLKLNQAHKKAKFVFSNIENFWRAYDLSQKETSSDKKVEIYQREYYEKATG